MKEGFEMVGGVSAKFRKVMANRGISVVEAAKKLGLTKQAVSYALGHRERWRESDLEFWCARLGISKEKVVGEE
jgi:predicted transcriptional regulator